MKRIKRWSATSKSAARPASVEGLESRRLLSSNLVADFGGIFPTNTVELNGISYFAADDGIHGEELWKSDGTTAGTALVKDLISGTTGSQITLAGELGGAALFFSRLDDGTLSLWRSDGTTGGTNKLADIGHQDSRAKLLSAIVGDRLIFLVHGGDADPRVTLWSSGGSSANTSLIKLLWEGPDYNYVEEWFVAGEHVVIPTLGNDLWGTDGTTAGTVNIGASITSGSNTSITPANFALMGGELYFATETQPQTILWKTDGTLAGTVAVKNFAGAGNLARFITVNDRVIFQVVGNDIDAMQVWRTDGTGEGTEIFATIDGRIHSSLIQLGDAALFFVSKDQSGQGTGPFEMSLWRSDATTAGTFMVKDMERASWSMDSLAIVNGMAFFMLTAKLSNPYVRDHRELWRTDGTEDGTAIVQDLSQYRRTDLEEQMSDLHEQGGGIPTVLDAEDRDSVVVTSSDGLAVVTTPDETLVFDPSTMTEPIGPAQGYVRLDAGGVLRIFGTRDADNIRIYRMSADPNRFVVNLNGVKKSFAFAAVTRIHVYAYSGDDAVAFYDGYGAVAVRSRIWAGDGDDLVHGGSSRDTVYGEGGADNIRTSINHDLISGGTGDDWIFAGNGNDTVTGDEGADCVLGGSGADVLGGGVDVGEDSVDGGSGADVIFGSAVFDIFFNPQQAGDPLDEILMQP